MGWGVVGGMGCGRWDRGVDGWGKAGLRMVGE